MIWLATPDVAGSGASANASVHLRFSTDVESARNIPVTVLKEAERYANRTLHGSGLSGPERSAAWARTKWDYVASWIKRQPESVFRTPAPGKAGGMHFAFKPDAWKSTSTVLTEVSGKGCGEAAEILAKRFPCQSGVAIGKPGIGAAANIAMGVVCALAESSVANTIYRENAAMLKNLLQQMSARNDIGQAEWQRIGQKLDEIKNMKQSATGYAWEFVTYGQGSLLEKQAIEMSLLAHELAREHGYRHTRTWGDVFSGRPGTFSKDQ